ncbi:MAG: hypothetical protein ACTHLT_05445 [Devosia sp.]
MLKNPRNLPAAKPVYAVMSLADLLKVERLAAEAGLSVAEAVRGVIVAQLLRSQAKLSMH